MRSFAERFPAFKLRLTRWGGVFLFSVLVLALAGVNTGNNALMLLLGFALGSFIVSGIWSRDVLEHVMVDVVPPRELFAGQAASFEVRVRNESRFFPGYGVKLVGRDGGVVLVVPFVPSGGEVQRSVEMTLDRRGWVNLGPWRLEVALPLGFFVKSKTVVPTIRLLVYPRLVKRTGIVKALERGRRSYEDFRGRGREGEVVQLREFLEGDERRQIHWKQTARQRRLIVTDRQRPVSEPVFLVVDPRVDDPLDPVIRNRFERIVSEAATTVIKRTGKGEGVGLLIGGQLIEAVSSPSRAASLLRPLAEVKLQKTRLTTGAQVGTSTSSGGGTV